MNDVPLTSQWKKYEVERTDQDAHDNEVYRSTEIEMTNYPALLTQFEFSIHCADSRELSGTESEFVNCTCKNCGKQQPADTGAFNYFLMYSTMDLILFKNSKKIQVEPFIAHDSK